MIEQCIYFIITEKQTHYSKTCVELISSGATCWLVACLSLLLFIFRTNLGFWKCECLNQFLAFNYPIST